MSIITDMIAKGVLERGIWEEVPSLTLACQCGNREGNPMYWQYWDLTRPESPRCSECNPVMRGDARRLPKEHQYTLAALHEELADLGLDSARKRSGS